MEPIILPAKIEIKKGKNKNEATITVEPCYYGYGTTLGNAIRRVMLSSLPGAAATAVKIKGVQHEFSTIPHVKEDVVEVLLNLKQLRLKVFSTEPVRLVLKASGETEATAADILESSDVEIINKDLHIATLTSKNADLEMEIFVSQGRGFLPVEAREKEKLELGAIAFDSIFAPIKNIGYKVENVRIGDITNYDRLVLDIETDGTITPEEALKQSAQILIDHFDLFLNGTGAKEEIVEKVKEEEAKEEVVAEAEETPTEEKEKKKRGRPKKTK
ncbi:DNA-directed RNA polymerase subunit alpha [Patescibacteria group bacterium]|nr:DNA-directed RNA polymerase subunit alpha [Patescibacteria group bacterium]